MPTQVTPTQASTTLPSLYRFLLLNIEPVLALGGVFLTLFQPATYTSQLTQEAVTKLDPGTHFIYTQLAGGWLFFVFTEAVVLRLVDDVRVWRLLCTGMLLSDVAYCHSCAQALGGWAQWLKVAEWTAMDWVVTVTTWPFVLTRCAIVLGLGFKTVGAKRKRK